MLILFDVGVPRGLAKYLTAHTVTEARERGWDRISNGELIRTAEATGFDLFLTNDTNLEYQQDVLGRRIAILVLSHAQWPMVQLVADKVADAVSQMKAGDFKKIEVPLSPRKQASRKPQSSSGPEGTD